FAPLERNRYFGLNFSWIMALTCPYASTDCVPPTTMSGLAAATFATIGVRSAVSGGEIVLNTVLMPAFSNRPRMRSAIGDENGSSSYGYATVFGRLDFGSER